ncbi:MAG: hypothetical protein JW780_05505 [Clostridiales bacterium]|nr:hypothetical protein [Clostridiales bacterium]
MRKLRSLGCLAVIFAIVFSSLLSGCFDRSKTSDEITATVDSYFSELRSGAFSKNGYSSSYTKDTPFANLVFADEGVRPCMDTAIENVIYEVSEVEGDTKSETGSCTLSVTVPDPDKALESVQEEWVTAEHLSNAIASEDSETAEYKVSLEMEYDAEAKKWAIADSSELANAIGVPYSELNLYSEAGDPRLSLTTFLEALATGKYAEVAPLLQKEDAYDLLFPEEVDIQIRRAFFEQMQFEILNTTMSDGGSEIEVRLDHIDLQSVSDRLAQSADLVCEMFKFILSGLLSESETPTFDNYELRFVQISLDEITHPNATRLQETFVFRLELSDDGKEWQIKALPTFMTTTEYESEPTDDRVNRAALGMALIELYDEGIITKSVLDEQLREYGLEGLKYSSRKVCESLINYSFLDVDTLEEVESYRADETYQLLYMLEFDRDWPGLTYDLLVIDDATDNVINSFEVATDTPFPSIYAGTVGNDGELWAPGSYTLLFILEDSTVLVYMSIEVK